LGEIGKETMSQEGFSDHLRVGDVFNILLGIRFAREIDDKNEAGLVARDEFDKKLRGA